MKSPLELSSFEQLKALCREFGAKAEFENPMELMLEVASLMQDTAESKPSCQMVYTKAPNPGRRFDYGCDLLVKLFEDQWKNAFENTKKPKHENIQLY